MPNSTICSEWIPVEEKLPDDDVTVLIGMRGADEPVWMGWHDGDGWHSVDAAPLYGIVTHWMPMIEGPK